MSSAATPGSGGHRSLHASCPVSALRSVRRLLRETRRLLPFDSASQSRPLDGASHETSTEWPVGFLRAHFNGLVPSASLARLRIGPPGWRGHSLSRSFRFDSPSCKPSSRRQRDSRVIAFLVRLERRDFADLLRRHIRRHSNWLLPGDAHARRRTSRSWLLRCGCRRSGPMNGNLHGCLRTVRPIAASPQN